MPSQSDIATPRRVFIAPSSTSGDFAPAYNNLGWVRQMVGDAEGAECCYGQALQFDPSLRAARKNLLMLLVKSGRRHEAFELWLPELTSDQDPTIFLEDQLSRALLNHDLYLAGEYAALLAAFRCGSKWHPTGVEGRGATAFLMERALFLTIPKLIHDVEQFSYLQSRQVLGSEFTPVISAYEQLIDEMRSSGIQAPTPLNEDVRARIGHVYNRIVHIRETRRLARALSGEWNAATVETDYLETGVVVVDNFLTKEALDNVRQFCLEFNRLVGQPLQPWAARRIFSRRIQLPSAVADRRGIAARFAARDRPALSASATLGLQDAAEPSRRIRPLTPISPP